MNPIIKSKQIRSKHLEHLSSEKGFTLVEIAIAVAILGLAFSTLIGLHTKMIDTYSLERNRNIASLIGQYMLAIIEVAPQPPDVGTDSGILRNKLQDYGYFEGGKDYFKDELQEWEYISEVTSYDLAFLEDVYRRIELNISWGEQVDQSYKIVYFVFTNSYN